MHVYDFSNLITMFFSAVFFIPANQSQTGDLTASTRPAGRQATSQRSIKAFQLANFIKDLKNTSKTIISEIYNHSNAYTVM